MLIKVRGAGRNATVYYVDGPVDAKRAKRYGIKLATLTKDAGWSLVLPAREWGAPPPGDVAEIYDALEFDVTYDATSTTKVEEIALTRVKLAEKV